VITWFLIFTLPGSFVFGGFGWLWRYRLKGSRPNLFLVLLVSFVAWISSMIFGWFLYLDVLKAGQLAPALSPGVIWSFMTACLTYFVLRRKIEPPIPLNDMEYFKK
jgi:hypothetical protein